jgi:adenosine kinase
MSSLIVIGSIAYDHIMVFKDEFRRHLLPDRLHMINVAFNVDDLSQQFGGTAGNIAYNLALLGEKPLLVASVGGDAAPYIKRIKSWKLKVDYVRTYPHLFTAQAFITTDLGNNQITAFHPGAMDRAHEQGLPILRRPPGLVMISANGAQAMIESAETCRSRGWKFWFDPGQSLNVLSGQQLSEAVQGSEGIIVNDYEWQLFQHKTASSLAGILERVPYVLVTLGEKGVDIISSHGVQRVSGVPDTTPIDPTGAGDAFRAGLLYGLSHHFDMLESCRYACAVASFAVEWKGSQNHTFSLDQVQRRCASITVY